MNSGLRYELSFTLANYTGDGFGGDMGYKSVSFLTEQIRPLTWAWAGLGEEEVKIELDEMVARGEATEKDGEYAKAPYKVQCLVCNNDPCSCGLGTWR